jgi:hypothetical protein
VDVKSVEQGARPDVVVNGVMQVDPAHGAHGPMVGCSEHLTPSAQKGQKKNIDRFFVYGRT